MKRKSVSRKFGMSLIIAGSMGVAMSMPVCALADGDDDYSVNPTMGNDDEGEGITIGDLNDAQRYGFLPYENGDGDDQGDDQAQGDEDDKDNDQGDDSTGGDDQGDDFEDDQEGDPSDGDENPEDGSDDSEDGQGDDFGDDQGDDPSDGDDNPEGGSDDSEDGQGEGTQVGDIVFDENGNPYVITALPDEGNSGYTITTLEEAQRLGFLALPDENEVDISAPKQSTAYIEFVGDEGHEDSRPISVVVNVYDEQGEFFSTGTVTDHGDGVYWGAVEVPGNHAPFSAIAEDVDHYVSGTYSFTTGKNWDFTLTLTYVEEQEEEVPEEDVASEENSVDKNEETEEKPVAEERETPSPKTAEAPKEFAPSHRELVNTGDTSLVAPTMTAISSLIALVGAFITKRLGA